MPGVAGVEGRRGSAAIAEFLTGQFGDPVLIAMGNEEPKAKLNGGGDGERAGMSRQLPPEVVFVVSGDLDRRADARHGRALPQLAGRVSPACGRIGKRRSCRRVRRVIGNPPWDRMKLQQVEWFAGASGKSPWRSGRATGRHDRGAGSGRRSAWRKTLPRLTTGPKRPPAWLGQAAIFRSFPAGTRTSIRLFVERAVTLCKPGGMVGLWSRQA